MAQVIDPTKNLIKLDDGKTITAQTGGWYDGMQYWGGTLSQPGQINTQSNQQGAGQLVSNEVIAQTNPANVAYIEQQRAKMGLSPSSTGVSPTPTYSPTSGTGAGVDLSGIGTTSTINLPGMYQKLYEDSGISAREQELTNAEKQYLEAKAKISDNPFLSASMVDKRLARLENKYNAIINPIKSDIATKKADIETKLNLETKQFDINSQSAKDALNYFNTLLDAGALTNASSEDIANLTRATGLSSTLIQSAITSKNEKNVETQVITSTADDGTVTASVINPKTGAVINQTTLGKIGNAQSSGGATATERLQLEQQETSKNLISDAQRGATLRELVGHYGIPGGLDIDTIYRLYNTYNTSYGKASETLDEVKQGVFYD